MSESDHEPRLVGSSSIRNWRELTAEQKREWARKFLGRIKQAAAQDTDNNSRPSDAPDKPRA